MDPPAWTERTGAPLWRAQQAADCLCAGRTGGACTNAGNAGRSAAQARGQRAAAVHPETDVLICGFKRSGCRAATSAPQADESLAGGRGEARPQAAVRRGTPVVVAQESSAKRSLIAKVDKGCGAAHPHCITNWVLAIAQTGKGRSPDRSADPTLPRERGTVGFCMTAKCLPKRFIFIDAAIPPMACFAQGHRTSHKSDLYSDLDVE